MPLPDWITTAGQTAGQTLGAVAHLPFDVLGGLLGGGQQRTSTNPEDPAAWKRPDRYALAVSYMPDGLNPMDRAQRMSALYQYPFITWPKVIRDFQKQDLAAAEIHADPDAQALYREGGPEAWQARYPGIPLPPSRPIRITDYPPLDDLDQAIAHIGGTERVPLPEPITTPGGPAFSRPAAGKAFAHAKDTLNLNTLLGGAPEDQRAVQGLPPTLGYEAERQRRLDQARNQGQFTGVFPGETPVGPARPSSVDGLLGTPATGGVVYYKLADGVYTTADGTLVQGAPPAGATVQQGYPPGVTVREAREPGAPAASAPAAPAAAPAVPSAATLADRFPPIEILPGESMSTFEQRKHLHDLDVQAAVAAEAASRPTGPEREKSATALDLVTRLKTLKQTYAEAQNQHLGGALGGFVEKITQGQPTGPIAAWTKVPLARYSSLGTDAQRRLIREQAAIENQFIQIITGAQVSWQEAVRLARQLPSITDGPEFFLQGIDTSLQNLEGLEATKRAVRSGVPGLTSEDATAALAEGRRSGGETGTPAGAPATAPAGTGKRIRTLSSGKTIVEEP